MKSKFPPKIGDGQRTRPGYVFGRIRTSTAVLAVAFVAVWWVYGAYRPPSPKSKPAQVPATEVVPPGFVPDPNYTWVPRTRVRPPSYTPPPTTTTTTTLPPTTTTPPLLPFPPIVLPPPFGPPPSTETPPPPPPEPGTVSPPPPSSPPPPAG